MSRSSYGPRRAFLPAPASSLSKLRCVGDVQALRYGIAGAVTIIWTATYGRYVIAGGLAPPPELSAVMLAVVTWALGSELRDVVKKRREDNGD